MNTKKTKIKADLNMFIKLFQPIKFKELANGVEIRSVSDVQGAAIRARELINKHKLTLVVVNNADIASYKAFEVREVDMALIVAESKKALSDLKTNNLYFKSIDDTHCYRLEEHLNEAKAEGLKEITLVKANPDDGTTDFIWCTYNGECVEHSDCKKSECSYYESKSGRGVCQHRGHLYLHGEEETFKIKAG